MKELMLGNKAAARGLYEAGCAFVSSYPGTPSTEITEEAVKYDDIYCEWAPNEKVALESAFGACLAGKRSFAGMKHVGLNVAADPLYTMSYTGVNAGLVIGVADDPGMHSSQNEQDSRHHAIASKVPMLSPSDSAEAREFVLKAFDISEEYDTPVLLKMCTRVSHSQSAVETGDRKECSKPYEKNISKYVMTPANAIRRHPLVEERMKKLIDLAEESELNRIEGTGKEKGIICDATSYQYVKEATEGDSSVSILKLGIVNPLPVKKILDFAKDKKELFVVEELDPIIENHCKVLGLSVHGKDILPVTMEFSQNMVRKALGYPVPSPAGEGFDIPIRPPAMCAGCPHRGLFFALKKNKCTVLGDIGCYTLAAAPPLGTMEMTLCMGASLSGIHGFNKAGGKDNEKKTVAVIGDSTFMHSGMTGLANIAYNQSNSTVVILDNSITGMTGHQQNPLTGKNIKGDPAGHINLEALVRSMGIERVRVVDPYNLKECEDAVKEELNFDGPSVIISRRPCVLLKYVKHSAPLSVDPEKCRSCKACMQIGCPALSMKKVAVVDETLCVGCGVCSQLCSFSAIS